VRSTRLASRTLAVVTLTAGALLGPGMAGAGAAPARAPQAEAEPTTPLSVVMTSMSPSTIPAKGTLQISGTVLNQSKEQWSDITVAPFLSSTPMTTRDELAEAAASDPEVAVGERLTDDGASIKVGDLDPGDSAAFTLSIKARDLTITEPGVYWIGVHALGASAEGRDLNADGRARTFIPLVPRSFRLRTIPVSVVLPLRERARRASDGSLNGPARWVNLTKPDGRLTRLADFAATAGTTPITWLVDPAVLDALQDFGAGNPPLSLGSTRPRSDEEADGANDQGDGDQPGSSPSPSPSPTPISGTPTDEERAGATRVLESLLPSLRTQGVLTLGYADPDVASLARRGPNLLRRSEEIAVSSMKTRKLTGTSVVAPPQGYFDPGLLSRIRAGSVMLLSDHGDLTEPPLSRLPAGQDLVLGDQRTLTGGPLPNAPRSPLALRQRILAEAALEISRGATPVRPIVVVLPPKWNPGPDWQQADFFGGLEVPWLRMAPVPRGATTAYDGELRYPRTQLASEVRASNVAATRRLAHTSTVFGHLLANDNAVTDLLTGAALQASAYSAKPTLGLAADQVLALDATAQSQMDHVQVIGTDFVTLSGGSGTLTVTLVNGLQQPITVGLRSRADSAEVKVETPEPVSMRAGQRTTLRLRVSSPVGVHEVTLSPVTSQGERAGTPLTFNLRTSQVGRLIWYVIVAGGVLLAVMIVRRIVLRIRLNRWRVNGR
jgi:hypothetical protein